MFKRLALLTASILIAGSLYAGNQGNNWSVGSNTKGIELTENGTVGYLFPVTDSGVNLGSTTRSFDSLYVNNVNAENKLILTPTILQLTNAVSTKITPTTPLTILTTTGAVTLNGTGVAVISTTSVSTGQYIQITSTSTTNVTMATGAAHYVIAPTSPTIITQYDVFGFVFNGNYWVMVSSAVQ